MELTFKGDATELVFLIKRLQEIQGEESLADVLVKKLPSAVIDKLNKRDGY